MPDGFAGLGATRRTLASFSAGLLNSVMNEPPLPMLLRPVLPRHALRGKQAVLFQKRDDVAVEFPRLLDLADVTGAIKDLHFAAGDARLKRRCTRMCAVLAARQNDRRAGDP